MMPSNAHTTFLANKSDLDRLWWFHNEEAGDEKGRKFGVEVLNKAVVVFVCAAWEAFCEDIVLEAVNHIKDDLTDFNKLPKGLKTKIALQLKEDKNHQSPWRLAGNGWKKEIVDNTERLIAKLNTPKSEKLIVFFEATLGIKDITDNWNWKNCARTQVVKKLDASVTLRGSIAHRLKPNSAVHKHHGEGFFHSCRSSRRKN